MWAVRSVCRHVHSAATFSVSTCTISAGLGRQACAGLGRQGRAPTGPRGPLLQQQPSAAPGATLTTSTTSSSLTTPIHNHATSSEEAFQKERDFAANNYSPLPVVFARAEGCNVVDPEGNHYYDFLAAYSAVNQGHSHPRLIKRMNEQAALATLSSRAFFNDVFPEYAQYITQYFGYDRVLPTNTGAEAVETAIKLARKWSNDVKGVKDVDSIILSACGCFHGRTYGAISMSCDPDARNGFAPFLPGLDKVVFGDLDHLRLRLEEHKGKVAAYIVEPIQGEAGVIIPPDGYLKEAAALCKEHGALFVADEIQTGIARTGSLLACDAAGVKPDVVLLGKALSGGMYPVSAVLGSHDVIGVFGPGTHGSTYGGNPLGAAIAMEALDIVRDEDLVERSHTLGEVFRDAFDVASIPAIKEMRGRGLFNAFDLDPAVIGSDKSAYDFCLLLKSRGLLCKHTHGNTVRMAPPLIITRKQLDECIDIIRTALLEFPSLPRDAIPGVKPFKPVTVVQCERCGIDLEL